MYHFTEVLTVACMCVAERISVGKVELGEPGSNSRLVGYIHFCTSALGKGVNLFHLCYGLTQ